jgi:signal transduction histidine kinase
MSIFFENKRARPFILMLVYIVFVSFFLLLHHRIDYIVNLYYGLPIILASYYYGFFAGIILMVLEAIVHIFIFKLMGEDFTFIYMNNRVRVAFISLMIVAYIVSLFRKVKDDLIISEKRFRVVSEELHRINATKDKFFSIIAHDLRGPIGTINANIDLLVNSKNEIADHEKDKILYALHTMSTRVFNLLENLLKWALMQKGDIYIHIEKINIRKLCEECVLLFEYIAKEKKISLISKIEIDCFVMTDKNALEAVVRNLISNALKFSNSNGRVEVSAKVCGERVCLVVSDNGVGIPEDKINKLFDLDYHVVGIGTQGERGTGLGLILCNELIRKCNGSIFVESTPDVGSTFTIELPKAE